MPKPAPAALLGGPFPGDQVQAPVPQPPKREAGRVLQDEVVQHSDGGAHRPAPGGGVYAHSIAEHSGVSVCVCIVFLMLCKSQNHFLFTMVESRKVPDFPFFIVKNLFFAF